MDETVKIVQEHYDSRVLNEWNRIANRPEFLLTCRMFDRYIKTSDKVLDIGGGPGRYSLYLADKCCDVTLFDLSPENVKFAKEQAAEQNLPLKAVCGDGRIADKLVNDKFDHVLLMGPMYHLLEETDRIAAVNAALNLLKPGGIIFVSFITLFAVMIYYMKQAPEGINLEQEKIYVEHAINQKTYAGEAFTKVVFREQSEILPFMSQFPLEKLHLFGQESITSPCESNIMSQPQEIINLWLDLCEKMWEREDLLSWSEHIMYVGRKI
jgi:2-polyprenyl-3-methyl-5-hydroxy-6-metoxy-1,4-benzoquinol methylase